MKTKKEKGRREFLKTTLQGTAIMALSVTGASELLASCGTVGKNFSKVHTTGFDQDPLPYAYDALEGAIDARTMEIHYTKHAAGYAKNLKEAAIAESVDIKRPVEEILRNISKYSLKMRNNAGGHYNHEMFWKSMRPIRQDNKPTGDILQAIEKSFKTFENFKAQFTEVAKSRFGSGWAWLYSDSFANMKIGSTPNQDNPLMDISDIKGFPLLGLDVWEHAYYLKYQNKRADYIENWWSIVNWDYVQGKHDVLKG